MTEKKEKAEEPEAVDFEYAYGCYVEAFSRTLAGQLDGCGENLFNGETVDVVGAALGFQDAAVIPAKLKKRGEFEEVVRDVVGMDKAGPIPPA